MLFETKFPFNDLVHVLILILGIPIGKTLKERVKTNKNKSNYFNMRLKQIEYKTNDYEPPLSLFGRGRVKCFLFSF